MNETDEHTAFSNSDVTTVQSKSDHGSNEPIRDENGNTIKDSKSKHKKRHRRSKSDTHTDSHTTSKYFIKLNIVIKAGGPIKTEHSLKLL